MDEFDVQPVRRSTDRIVKCPRCDNTFRVVEEWPGPSPLMTRMCPWCSGVSNIPGFSAVLYDGHDTFKLSKIARDSLLAVRLIRYEPEHGPHGIMYVPRDGWTAEQVMSKLVRR